MGSAPAHADARGPYKRRRPSARFHLRRWTLCPLFGADLSWRIVAEATQRVRTLELARAQRSGQATRVVATDASRYGRSCAVVSKLSGVARSAEESGTGDCSAHGD